MADGHGFISRRGRKEMRKEHEAVFLKTSQNKSTIISVALSLLALSVSDSYQTKCRSVEGHDQFFLRSNKIDADCCFFQLSFLLTERQSNGASSQRPLSVDVTSKGHHQSGR